MRRRTQSSWRTEGFDYTGKVDVMKRFSRLFIAAAAMLVMASPLAAQTSSGIVNSLEVKRLITDGTPAANATLAKHFAALADKYAAEAASHRVMASAYSGNPNHSLGGSMGLHCRALAQLATDSEKTAREMVTYHTNLAAGAAPEPPKNAAAFDAGKGAPAPTPEEVKRLAAAAHTSSDHHALEEYFLTLAKQKTAEATAHATMANSYRVSGQRRGSEFAAMHCDSLAKQARDAAKEATASAELHRQLANVG
jgi:hypothetical protein